LRDRSECEHCSGFAKTLQLAICSHFLKGFFMASAKAAKATSSAKAPSSLRRQPSQARSQQTMQTLFKAAAQIFDKDGEGGLTTNKVAAAAGFSIGTLYQYFPSKEALMRAMAARGQDLVLQALERYLSELENQHDVQQVDGRELLGKAIRILIRGFATGQGLSQSLIRTCWTLEQPEETASAVRQVSERLAIFFERIQHPALHSPSSAQWFVLTRSVIGTLRSASLEKSPLLGSPAFEAALLQMAWAVLARDTSRSV
jgi:AcrR family transcriptional regulator